MVNQLTNMVVGDLIEVVNSKSTGYENGEIGIIVKIDQVTKETTIYWTMLGSRKDYAPFWAEEIKVISGSN